MASSTYCLVAYADGSGVVPAGPCGPVGPVAPVSPLRLWKANANVLAEAMPPSVTLTDGVPVEESTVALAPVMVASTF